MFSEVYSPYAPLGTAKFQVGDIVKVNNGQGFWQNGEIISIRDDGTYDIQYKNGTVKQVKENHMLQICLGRPIKNEFEKHCLSVFVMGK